VIHAVARIVSVWEPRHRSVYRRSAASVEGATLEWLAHEWHGRPSPAEPFVVRFASQWRASRRWR
jgi:hypothetical protein